MSETRLVYVLRILYTIELGMAPSIARYSEYLALMLSITDHFSNLDIYYLDTRILDSYV